jgi:uncharacterized protein (TIGR02147 family)
MIKAYEFDNYRQFLEKRLKAMPKKGYGQMSLLARFLTVHTSLVSQIIKGHKELTTDQAALVADYFGLSALETEYFVLLVQSERAGNRSAKALCKKQLQRVREQAQTISKRLDVDGKLSEEERAVFYSDWTYSAVRQAVAIPGVDNVDSIAAYLDLSREKVQRCLEFLIRTGLCKASQNKISVGPLSTHVEASSSWVRVHHTNWRLRAVSSLDGPLRGDLHYTLPLTISAKDSDLLRERILQFIEQAKAIIDPSPSEEMFCLNIDWFKVAK